MPDGKQVREREREVDRKQVKHDVRTNITVGDEIQLMNRCRKTTICKGLKDAESSLTWICPRRRGGDGRCWKGKRDVTLAKASRHYSSGDMLPLGSNTRERASGDRTGRNCQPCNTGSVCHGRCRLCKCIRLPGLRGDTNQSSQQRVKFVVKKHLNKMLST